jgi:hypothetical protein
MHTLHSPLLFVAEIRPKHLVFLLPWVSPWFYVSFLLSPSSYAQSFLRKPKVSCFDEFFSLVFGTDPDRNRALEETPRS